MARKLGLIGSAVVLAAFLAAPGISDAGGKGKAGNSNTAHMYFFQKDMNTWDIVEDGAWAKMAYNASGSEMDFVFNGHGLMPDGEYTLIYYPDPWPGAGLICLGDGTANGGGNVHISGSAATGDLPAEWDDNFESGAKIWLVASMDVDCEGDDANLPQMIGWAPDEYLFEYDLLTFDDTDE